jgi:hypothetical protein
MGILSFLTTIKSSLKKRQRDEKRDCSVAQKKKDTERKPPEKRGFLGLFENKGLEWKPVTKLAPCSVREGLRH